MWNVTDLTLVLNYLVFTVLSRLLIICNTSLFLGSDHSVIQSRRLVVQNGILQRQIGNFSANL